jgi:hypothetical protein
MKNAHLIALIVAPIFLLLISGCTHLMKAPTTTISDYPVTEKINLRVGLVILPELTDAKWEFHYMGDTWLLPLGENLTRNSENMTKQLFSSVSVHKVTTAKALPGVEATLIPKMKAFEQSSGAFAWSEAVTTIVLEWTLLDSKDNIVWADTIRADAKGKLGSRSSQDSNDEKRTQQAIEKVFYDSFVAISKAQEIRNLVAK